MNVRHTTAPWKATGYNVHTGGTVAFCQTNCPRLCGHGQRSRNARQCQPYRRRA